MNISDGLSHLTIDTTRFLSDRATDAGLPFLPKSEPFRMPKIAFDPVPKPAPKHGGKPRDRARARMAKLSRRRNRR